MINLGGVINLLHVGAGLLYKEKLQKFHIISIMDDESSNLFLKHVRTR